MIAQTLKLVHDEKNKDFTLADRQLQYKTAMQLYKMHEVLAAAVDDINEKQKMMKDNLEKVKDGATKILMEEFNTKLETERAEMLSTKQKSRFADEERLREKITEVYSSVAGQEAPPSNLQVQRVGLLEKDVVKSKMEVKQINDKYYKPIFDQLVKEGLVKPKAY